MSTTERQAMRAEERRLRMLAGDAWDLYLLGHLTEAESDRATRHFTDRAHRLTERPRVVAAR
jgi:hypothetical protein